MMSTTSRFESRAFSGEWNIIARIGDTEARKANYRYDVSRNGGLYWTLGKGRFDHHGFSGMWNQLFKSDGTGQLVAQVNFPEFGENQLVHWVDEDFRTAVVGYASRENAWILNRTPTLRADRLQAAKDILKFNGYDLTQLKMTPQ